MPTQKPVGGVATFVAEVRNKDLVLLPDAQVAFTDDSADAPVVDPANPHTATVTGSSVETVTVTATVQGADGPISATDVAVFVDNVPASVTLVAS